jgi:23S rRNA pseudouridine1911/1915/1917 synthase
VGRVHRLDRDTSGALVFALDPATRAGLIALFRDHRIERRYLALVEGEVRNDQGKVEAAISEEWDKGRRRLARPGEAASPAVTRYRVRERFPRAALLEVELETGRQHQIRLHLAHLGLPILGERIYRGPGRSTVRSAAPPAAAPRQMLHAEILGFAHPVSGRAVRVTSPLPADFLSVLGALRRRRPPRTR